MMSTAPGILERGGAHLQQLVALALGSIKTDASREMLWRMVEAGAAAEQSKIALTWIWRCARFAAAGGLDGCLAAVQSASRLWGCGIAVAEEGCAGDESARVAPGMREGTGDCR